MKNYILFFILTFLLVGSLFQLEAQKPQIEWSDVFNDAGYGTPEVVAYDKDAYFVKHSMNRDERVRMLNANVELSKFSHSLKREKTVKINISGEEGKETFEYILSTANPSKLFLLTSLDSKRNGQSLHIRSIDKHTLSIPDKREKILAVSPTEMDQNVGFPSYSYVYSSDSTKVLVYYPFGDKNSSRYGLVLFDSDMKLIWQKTINIPYKKESFSLESMRIHNTGSIYFLGKITPKDLDKAIKKDEELPNYYYAFFSLGGDETEKEPVEYSLKDTGKFLFDVKLGKGNSDEEVFGVGVFLEESNNKQGIYTFFYDNTSSSMGESNYTYLDLSDYASYIELEREKGMRIAPNEMAKFTVTGLITESTGEKTVVLEVRYGTLAIRNYKDPNMSQMTYSDYSFGTGSILSIYLDKEGNYTSTSFIWKSQYSGSLKHKNYLSYFLMFLKGNPYVLYNDHIGNLGIPKEEAPRTYYTSSTKKKKIVLSQIDLGAKENKSGILDYSDSEGFLIAPDVCLQSSPNEILLILEKKNTFRLAKLTYGK